ncbi:MAG: IS3 family transposase [Candidatus Omnitrophica bacterium]|nr:IS3 family transposase [Candidatus Omnitrophota bacterium]
MISKDNRKKAIKLVCEAVKNGAQKTKSCELLEISIRTLQRWEKGNISDQRKGADKKVPKKLSAEERRKIIDTACNNRFKDMNPHEIVAVLAEEGLFIASERSFYRILKKNDLLKHRGKSRPKRKKNNKPEELRAAARNQVWSWDITYMRSSVRGMFFYLYLFIDIWSRKIVGWEVYEYESAEISSQIMLRLGEEYGVDGIRLHSDRGAAMKGSTMLMTLYNLGVIPSFSRPRVSDDNPYSESLFKTLKYTEDYPKYFSDIEHARKWVENFVEWYNTKHRHSGINYVTPDQRYNGLDIAILEKRNTTYANAKIKNPLRWSLNHKYWNYEYEVYLNPTNYSIACKKRA